MSDPMEAERVLTASRSYPDEQLSVDSVEGLREAVERVQRAEEGEEFVHCDDRDDYSVYRVHWGEHTESVLIDVLRMTSSYIMPDTNE